MPGEGEEEPMEKPKPKPGGSAQRDDRCEPANPGRPRGRAAYQWLGLGRRFLVREHARRESAEEGTRAPVTHHRLHRLAPHPTRRVCGARPPPPKGLDGLGRPGGGVGSGAGGPGTVCAEL